MQEIKSSCCGCGIIIESDGGCVTAVRNVKRCWSFYIRSGLSSLLSRMNKPLFSLPSASFECKHEVAIMYFGRASDFLLVTSERMVIPNETYTLEQVLNRLRKRGDRWAYELDDSHVVCTVNGKAAMLFDPIEAGVEISIFSRKSIFEI